MAPQASVRTAETGARHDRPDYLVVGYLRRPHGVRGEVVMEIHTDFPQRLKPGTRVFIGEQHLPLLIAQTRSHAEGLLIRFEGLDTPEAAARYRNQYVYVRAADRPPLPKGQYYHHELLGCRVVDEREGDLGVLTEILETGANDVYVVRRPDGREVLLPAIASVMLEVQVEARVVRVHLPAGLLDETGK